MPVLLHPLNGYDVVLVISVVSADDVADPQFQWKVVVQLVLYSDCFWKVNFTVELQACSKVVCEITGESSLIITFHPFAIIFKEFLHDARAQPVKVHTFPEGHWYEHAAFLSFAQNQSVSTSGSIGDSIASSGYEPVHLALLLHQLVPSHSCPSGHVYEHACVVSCAQNQSVVLFIGCTVDLFTPSGGVH